MDNYGLSTTVGQYGMVYLSSSTGKMSITGNMVNCGTSTNTEYGIVLQGFAVGASRGNSFFGCGIPFFDGRSGGAGIFVLSETDTYASVFGSVRVTAAANSLIEFDNHWDKLTSTYGQPALTSGWGTGATLATYSADNLARITVGTTPASPAVLTFNWTKNSPPVCVAIDETTSTTLTAVATTVAVTVTGTKAASDVVSVSCRPTT